MRMERIDFNVDIEIAVCREITSLLQTKVMKISTDTFHNKLGKL